MTNTNRLHRSNKDSMLFGVAGGMAEYFDIDPAIMRVLWVIFILATGGAALLAYIILAVILPKDDSRATEPAVVIRENLESLPNDAAEAGRHAREEITGISEGEDGSRKTQRWKLLGIIMIAIGIFVLLGNLGAFWWWQWSVLWPLVIVAIGIAILIGRARRS